MSLTDRARADIKRITSDKNGWGQQIVLVSPLGFVGAVYGLHRKINLGVDTEGNIVNSRQSYVSIHESILNEASYPLRTNGEVNLRNHLCYVRDVTGVICPYIISTWTPDEYTGIIPMFLEVYEPGESDVIPDFSILFPV